MQTKLSVQFIAIHTSNTSIQYVYGKYNFMQFIVKTYLIYKQYYSAFGRKENKNLYLQQRQVYIFSYKAAIRLTILAHFIFNVKFNRVERGLKARG